MLKDIDHMKYKRLLKEYKDLNNSPMTNLGCSVGSFDDENKYKWKVGIIGPKDSLYKGGLFQIELTFPKDYPESGPEIRFLTPIYHLDVFSGNNKNLGRVWPSFITCWKSSTTPREILTKLYVIFYKTDLDYSFDSDRKEEYIKHYDLFRSKVLFFTKRYASPFSKIKIDKNKGWDFSCYNYIFNPLNFRPKEEKIISYNKYDDNTEYINLIFSINGTSNKIEIKCQLKDTIRDIITRLSFKYHSYFDTSNLYIYSGQKLNIDIPIGYNSFRNNSTIIVIVTSDIFFYS